MSLPHLMRQSLSAQKANEWIFHVIRSEASSEPEKDRFASPKKAKKEPPKHVMLNLVQHLLEIPKHSIVASVRSMRSVRNDNNAWAAFLCSCRVFRILQNQRRKCLSLYSGGIRHCQKQAAQLCQQKARTNLHRPAFQAEQAAACTAF